MTTLRLRFLPLRILTISLTILLFAAYSPSASACSCTDRVYAPACELISGTRAVFLGESLGPISDPNTGAAQVYRFRVDRAYKGIPPQTREVQVYAGGPCGTEYPTGKRYIIFGYNDTQRPTAVMSGACSGSRLAARNQADIDYLENYARGKTATSVFGKVVQGGTFYDKLDADEIAPLAGVEVVLENTSRRLAAVTQLDGGYRFNDVPAGKYRLSARLEPYSPDPLYHEVEVEAGRCKEVFVTLRAHCGIQGVLLDEKGEPAAKKRVEILRQNVGGKWYSTPRMWTMTDGDGRFHFSDIDAGEYLLGYEIWGDSPSDYSPYPTTYYPGVASREGAQTVRLAAGQTLEGLSIKLLPPHKKRKITVRVVMPDGSPPGPNLLQVFTTANGLLKNLEGKGSDGVVILTGYQEREYEFKARYWLDNLGGGGPVFSKRLLVAEPVKLPSGKDAAEVKLILAREAKRDDYR